MINKRKIEFYLHNIQDKIENLFFQQFRSTVKIIYFEIKLFFFNYFKIIIISSTLNN